MNKLRRIGNEISYSLGLVVLLLQRQVLRLYIVPLGLHLHRSVACQPGQADYAQRGCSVHRGALAPDHRTRFERRDFRAQVIDFRSRRLSRRSRYVRCTVFEMKLADSWRDVRLKVVRHQIWIDVRWLDDDIECA